jgi:hypothetical protein
MNANSASCQLALHTNHCEFESSVNAANNIVFFPLGPQASCLPFLARARFSVLQRQAGRDACAHRVDLSISALSGAVTSETLASLKTTAPPERCAC